MARRRRPSASTGQRRGVGGAQQGQVVDDVESQQFQRPLPAVDGGVDQPVAAGLQRELADDVVVGDQQATIVDQEARAHRGLAVLRLEQRAHLQQSRARAFVDALAGAGERGFGGRAAGAGWGAGGCSGGLGGGGAGGVDGQRQPQACCRGQRSHAGPPCWREEPAAETEQGSGDAGQVHGGILAAGARAPRGGRHRIEGRAAAAAADPAGPVRGPVPAPQRCRQISRAGDILSGCTPWICKAGGIGIPSSKASASSAAPTALWMP